MKLATVFSLFALLTFCLSARAEQAECTTEEDGILEKALDSMEAPNMRRFPGMVDPVAAAKDLFDKRSTICYVLDQSTGRIRGTRDYSFLLENGEDKVAIAVTHNFISGEIVNARLTDPQ